MNDITGRYVAYIRVSAKGQGDGQSQKEQITMRYNIADWYEDVAVSGMIAATEREGFKALLKAVKEGDTVVVSEPSRIGRSQLDSLLAIKALSDKGVHLESAQHNGMVFNSDSGKIILSMMLSWAEYETKQRAERCRAGIKLARVKGVYKGRQKGSKNAVPSALSKRVKELINTTSLNDSAIARAAGCGRASVKRYRLEIDAENEAAFRAKYLKPKQPKPNKLEQQELTL